MDLFKPGPLQYIRDRARQAGYDPDQLTFFAVLRRNRQFFVEYVVFGLFNGDEPVVSAKDWPEKVLVRQLTDDDIMYSYVKDVHRYAKPTHWCSENTLKALVESGRAQYTDGGIAVYGKMRLGLSHRIPDGRISTRFHNYTMGKQIEVKLVDEPHTA